MKTRGIIVLCIGVACIAFMTWLGGVKAFLAFGGTDIDARVLSYEESAPGIFPARDWLMDYQFEFEGRTFVGHATFAAKVRPEPASTIRVRFFSRAPGISAPLAYLSGTALGGYLMGGWAIFLGLRFLRTASKVAALPQAEEAPPEVAAIPAHLHRPSSSTWVKRCPHCHGQAIGFGEWGTGVNAFRTQCRSCGAALKASRATYVAALITFLAVIGCVVGLASLSGGSRSREGWLRLAVIPIAVGITVVAYRFCGYEKVGRN